MTCITHKIMAKKDKYSADKFGSPSTTPTPAKENNFYFGKTNFKWMLIGLACIVFGFILMMGGDANTTPEGKLDPNYWNEDIFSIRRVRIAPFLVIAGFVIQVYAILKRDKK